MGIPGILKEIGKGERVALAKLAVEHLERTQRPLRIAIDAAIWNFQSQVAQGGKNPALRTLYYRLVRILALPIHPLFVYDGKNKPLVKRGRVVSRWGSCIANETSKKLLQQFRFPYHMAPGEAEAECAMLQKKGFVDMVMSQDGDAIMFGSNVTLRDWSKEGTKGNKSPTHVSLLDLPRIKERSGLDPDGMILVALLSGGDYDQDGVPGFGPGLACEVARAGFGEDLLELVKNNDEVGLSEWRDRLQYELESNESGYFKRKHKTLKIPDTFPKRTLVSYYTNPAVSKAEELQKLVKKWVETWESQINIPDMREYVGQTFEWLYKPGAWKFVRGMAPSLLAYKFRRSVAQHHVNRVEQISERRQHFMNDGMPEFRVCAVPAEIVGLDLDAEEDSPEHVERLAAEQTEDVADDVEFGEPAKRIDDEPTSSQSPKKQRKTAPWRPTDPEKMWIPETVVKLGVPALAEEWEQIQRDILSDPKKFATRRLKTTRSKTAPVTSRPVEQFFTVSKPAQRAAQDVAQIPHPTTSTSTTKASKLGGHNQCTEPRPLTSRTDSSAEPVVISSSPIDRASEPSIPLKSRRVIRSVSEELEVAALPSSVTRRRSRGAGKKTDNDSGARASPSKQLRRIESFFIAAAIQAKKEAAMESSAKLNVDRAVMPLDPTTGLATTLVEKHVFAAPRGSLPGSWRMLNLDEVIPPKSKRSARVSCVNMTVD